MSSSILVVLMKSYTLLTGFLFVAVAALGSLLAQPVAGGDDGVTPALSGEHTLLPAHGQVDALEPIVYTISEVSPASVAHKTDTAYTKARYAPSRSVTRRIEDTKSKYHIRYAYGGRYGRTPCFSSVSPTSGWKPFALE